jgi:hypothetical protein
MKIYAYKVLNEHPDTKPFEQALKDYADKPLPERLIDHGSVRLRLEDYRSRNGLLELNFVSMRLGSAPVRVAEDRPVAEINLEEDEFFGEETACLYDPASRYLLIQYNHYGPRISGIRETLRYGENGIRHGYEFVPKLHPTSERVFAAWPWSVGWRFRSRFRISPKRVSASPWANRLIWPRPSARSASTLLLEAAPAW